MEHPGFFERAAPLPLAALAQMVGADLAPRADRAVLIHDINALAAAGAGHLAFLENPKYLGRLSASLSTACLVAPALAAGVPARVAALVMAQPSRGFARALQHFYPEAMVPTTAMARLGEPAVHPT